MKNLTKIIDDKCKKQFAELYKIRKEATSIYVDSHNAYTMSINAKQLDKHEEALVYFQYQTGSSSKPDLDNPKHQAILAAGLLAQKDTKLLVYNYSLQPLESVAVANALSFFQKTQSERAELIKTRIENVGSLTTIFGTFTGNPIVTGVGGSAQLLANWLNVPNSKLDKKMVEHLFGGYFAIDAKVNYDELLFAISKLDLDQEASNAIITKALGMQFTNLKSLKTIQKGRGSEGNKPQLSKISLGKRLEFGNHCIEVASQVAMLSGNRQIAHLISQVGSAGLKIYKHWEEFSALTKGGKTITDVIAQSGTMMAINPLLGITSAILGLASSFLNKGDDNGLEIALAAIQNQLFEIKELVKEFRSEVREQFKNVSTTLLTIQLNLFDQFVDTKVKIGDLHIMALRYFGKLDHGQCTIMRMIEKAIRESLLIDYQTKRSGVLTAMAGRSDLTEYEYKKYHDKFLSIGDLALKVGVTTGMLYKEEDLGKIDRQSIRELPWNYIGPLVSCCSPIFKSDKGNSLANMHLLADVTLVLVMLIRKYPEYIFPKQDEALEILKNRLINCMKFVTVLHMQPHFLKGLIDSQLNQLRALQDDLLLSNKQRVIAIGEQLEKSFFKELEYFKKQPISRLPRENERSDWAGQLHTYTMSNTPGYRGKFTLQAAKSRCEMYHVLEKVKKHYDIHSANYESYNKNVSQMIVNLTKSAKSQVLSLEQSSQIKIYHPLSTLLLPDEGNNPGNKVVLIAPCHLPIDEEVLIAERSGLGRIRYYYSTKQFFIVRAVFESYQFGSHELGSLLIDKPDNIPSPAWGSLDNKCWHDVIATGINIPPVWIAWEKGGRIIRGAYSKGKGGQFKFPWDDKHPEPAWPKIKDLFKKSIKRYKPNHRGVSVVRDKWQLFQNGLRKRMVTENANIVIKHMEQIKRNQVLLDGLLLIAFPQLKFLISGLDKLLKYPEDKGFVTQYSKHLREIMGSLDGLLKESNVLVNEFAKKTKETWRIGLLCYPSVHHVLYEVESCRNYIKKLLQSADNKIYLTNNRYGFSNQHSGDNKEQKALAEKADDCYLEAQANKKLRDVKMAMKCFLKAEQLYKELHMKFGVNVQDKMVKIKEQIKELETNAGTCTLS